MGTHSMTVVKIDGEYKIAQYGAFDGYPEVQGVEALTFLRERMDEEKFKTAVRNAKAITKKKVKELWNQFGVEPDTWADVEIIQEFYRQHPELDQRTGTKILDLVQEHPDGIELDLALKFVLDWECAWVWVIDFDTRTFEAHSAHFNSQLPRIEDERFYFLKNKKEKFYEGAVLLKKFDLDNLPSKDEFLAAFEEFQEEAFDDEDFEDFEIDGMEEE